MARLTTEDAECVSIAEGRAQRVAVSAVLSVCDKKLRHRLPNQLPPPFGVILPQNVWVTTPAQ